MDREEYCIIGDCNSVGDKAHLVTRATIPKHLWDEPALYTYLCRRHHTEQHSLGIETFCKKYNIVHLLERARVFVSSLL